MGEVFLYLCPSWFLNTCITHSYGSSPSSLENIFDKSTLDIIFQMWINQCFIKIVQQNAILYIYFLYFTLHCVLSFMPSKNLKFVHASPNHQYVIRKKRLIPLWGHLLSISLKSQKDLHQSLSLFPVLGNWFSIHADSVCWIPWPSVLLISQLYTKCFLEIHLTILIAFPSIIIPYTYGGQTRFAFKMTMQVFSNQSTLVKVIAYSISDHCFQNFI